MRIAIVHYHLRPGGVTSVIGTTSEALVAADIQHTILTGSDEVTGPNHHFVSGLEYQDYLSEDISLATESLTRQLREAAITTLGSPPDVWHFHNHSLGKNALIPHVISRLAEAGEAILLHIHDLAEQGRPENYHFISGLPDLYPFSPRIHFAFLNSLDLKLFTDAGLPPAYADLLANPIPHYPVSPPLPVTSPPLLFAPVRGIRRKNLGELALIAALAPTGARVAVSRAPENPAARPIHDSWSAFAARHHLPIGFDVVERYSPCPGATMDFDSWITHATHFITTSVSEGFGLTTLESIARGKPLLGRRLPHLTDALGFRAGFLYDAILVPIEWVDLNILREQVTLAMERRQRLYQRPFVANSVTTALEIMVQDGYIDFGNLPEPLQQGIIERLADATQRETPLVLIDQMTRPLNDWLAEVLAERSPTATPDQLASWSPQTYQRILTSIYHRLVAAPNSPRGSVPPDKILDHHLTPENFHFLLTPSPQPVPAKRRYRAVIFDIYGTLLIAPPGGVKPAPLTDPLLREIIRQHGHPPPSSPSGELHTAVIRHHAAANLTFPEIDLRVLWRQILGLAEDHDVTALVLETEAAWHPALAMPGAVACIQILARSGISLGLLSNAQCNTLPTLGPVADLFAPELTLLSYQLGIAKPAPEIYQIMVDRLAGRGIAPHETLMVGNDPRHDILPAADAGFRTALFIGHSDSLRPGDCQPDIIFGKWMELATKIR